MGQVESSSEVESEGENSVENDHTNLSASSQQRQLVPPAFGQSQAAQSGQQALNPVFAAHREHLEAQKEALEQRYKTDRGEVLRQTALIDERMRKLEDKEAKRHAERDATDLEMRQLRDENLRLMKQSNEEAQKHQREMGDLARMYANQPQQPAPVFDTSALEKVVREVQSQQLSRADIDKIIQDRVAHQLSGVARQKDLDAAGSRMEKALSQLPRGVSAEQVQQAVNQQLCHAVNKLSLGMQGQLRLPEFVQGKQSLNLPEDSDGPSYPIARPPAGDTSLTKVKKMRKGKEKVTIHTVQDPATTSSALAHPSSQSTQRTSMDIAADLTKLLRKDKRTFLKSLHNEKRAAKTPKMLMPTHGTLSGQSQTGSSVATLQQHDAMPTTSGNEDTALPDDFPENASQITSWERSKSSKKSPSALPNIEESSSADQSLVKKSKHDKSRVASISDVFTRGSKALAKVDRSVSGIPGNISNAPPPNMMTSLELPTDFPENASQISTWERKRSGTIVPLLSGGTPTAQIEAAPGSMPGQELVRSSKSKKQGIEGVTGVMPGQELVRSGKSKKHDSK